MTYPGPEPDTEPSSEAPYRYEPPPASYTPPHYAPPSYEGGQYGAYEQAQPRANRGGLAGWLTSIAVAAVAVIKYGGVLLFKIPLLMTVVTMLLSFLLYAWQLGPLAAGGFVVMLLLHELGHFVEVRRQGIRATAPIFIPFFGAAIIQRTMAADALRQAEVAIAGPIAGTLASIAALVLYSATGWPELLVWAGFGFAINLFNMIPFGMFDGGWILGAASKWFQVAGAILFAAAVVVFHLSPVFVLLILVLMGPAVLARFRNDASPYYRSVPVTARWLMGLAWIGLVAILGFGLIQVQSIFMTLR